MPPKPRAAAEPAAPLVTPTELLQRLRAIRESVVDSAAWKIDADDTVLTVSENAEPLFGWHADDDAAPGRGALVSGIVAVRLLPIALDGYVVQAEEHLPVYRWRGSSGEDRVEASCPECLGGILADAPAELRSCGCYGLTPPVCRSCAVTTGGPLSRSAAWPCPAWEALTVTVGLLGSALSDLDDAVG